MSKNIDTARELFKNYKVDAMHFTSDGIAFEQIAHAEAHAATLADRSIDTVKVEDTKVAPAKKKAKPTDEPEATEPTGTEAVATEPVTEEPKPATKPKK